MDKGIYCLVFFSRGCTVPVGALGDISFAAGWYVYVGSALGSGGLKRLDRHVDLFLSRDRKPTWHVDYLLTCPDMSLGYAICAPTPARLECRLAREIGGPGVAGFGCSDCACTSHLLFREGDPRSELLGAFAALRLVPAIKSIIRPDGTGGLP
ncbi:MAG TPA: GIY-YIG nuclease family protein [Methanoregula sp.]|nr:GIY-YIG nuclease family protein [Methanoregula sp.]